MKPEVLSKVYNKVAKSVEDIYNSIIKVIVDIPYNPMKYFAIALVGLATLDIALIGKMGLVDHIINQIGDFVQIFKSLEPRHIFFLVLLICFFFAFKDKQK